MSTDRFDLAIIGGGPAGLAAASMAFACGLNSVLIDENPGLGGRVFHGIETERDVSILGTDRIAATTLARDAREAATVLSGHSVVDIVRDHEHFQIKTLHGNELRSASARRLLIATGARERSMAFPGWTLPGVMTAGGVQTLLKGARLVPAGPVVLAGSGPLLLLVAVQLLRHDVPVAAILDTTPIANIRRAMPRLAGALWSGSVLRRGVGLLASLLWQRVPIYRGVNTIAAQGDGSIRAVTFKAGKRTHRLDCALLATHVGILPDIQLAGLVDCQLRWDASIPGWTPVTDRNGKTSQDGVFIAGDAAGIGGAEAAPHRGRIAATAAAVELGAIAPDEGDRLVTLDRKKLRRLNRERAFLDTLFFPSPDVRVPQDDAVLVCRCEAVSAGCLRALAAADVAEINHVKSISRCGMGACQGRVCGPLAEETLKDATGRSAEAVGTFRVRPPLKPVPIGAYAAFASDDPPAEARFLYTADW